MRKSVMRVALFIVCLGMSVALVQTQDLAVDEASIIAEMELLIDSTADPSRKDRERVLKLIQKGIKAHDAGKFEKALGFYRDALVIDPLADNAFYEMALSSTSMGKQPIALDAVIRALAVNPKVETYHVLKASILDDIGLPERAIEAYRHLLEIQPDSYMGHLNLGITFTRMKDLDQAEAEILRAIDLQPDHPSGYFHVAFVYAMLEYDYDERNVLTKFMEVGQKDGRRSLVKKRLDELNTVNVSIDQNHPYPEIELMEKVMRVTWKTATHKATFPDARGYKLTFEEDKEAFTQVLTIWRETKEESSNATHGLYDLLLRIDDAGFLDEYIWYHRQRVFGERALQWMQANRGRMDAFTTWAKSVGILADEKP